MPAVNSVDCGAKVRLLNQKRTIRRMDKEQGWVRGPLRGD